MPMNRREALTVMSAMPTLPRLPAESGQALIEKHDQSLASMLERQVTEASSNWRGAYPNAVGIHQPGSAARLIEFGAAAYLHAQSKYHQDKSLVQRIDWAVQFLRRMQSTDGNIDLLTTNFNSPPDTGFVVEHVARAAQLARLYEDQSLEQLIRPFLLKAAQGLTRGGIHTPNHRWVVSAALAQVHQLYPNEKYLQRIDEWLAEGIDIDEEGQFIERSTAIYNAVCDNALLTMALKLERPDLIEPVRQNLDAMLYLLHPNFEVVTEISRRQDINTQATMQRYWFPLRYLAIHDQNGQYAALVRQIEPHARSLPLMMEYEELTKPLPPNQAIPTDYQKHYALAEITRIRRGPLSATIMHKGNHRWFCLRWGNAVINAVRFASAFFGKGQFVPERFEQRDGVFHFQQTLRGPYYQPIQDESLLPITRSNWGERRQQRQQTEICEMHYQASIQETRMGFQLQIQATGTPNVPLAVEINLRQDGELESVLPAPQAQAAYLFENQTVTYRRQGDAIRIGPGIKEHAYTQLRGADNKLPGPSLYLTAYTPFDHIITFECI